MPLVSKRLHTLCCAPELLRELEVDLIGNRALPRAQALLAWLSQRAAQVRKLELTIKMNDAIATSACSELVAVVSSCLAVMGAAGQSCRVDRIRPHAAAEHHLAANDALAATSILGDGGEAVAYHGWRPPGGKSAFLGAVW